MRLAEGKNRWLKPAHLQGVLPHRGGGAEPNRRVNYMGLKALANDRRTSSGEFDEFRGLLSTLSARWSE
ncbi:hypothetical protein TNCV_74271 [Trichonephila clavipes]|nr:hypothetical protein TNCV_74271 [Trichonephila clavipes]